MLQSDRLLKGILNVVAVLTVAFAGVNSFAANDDSQHTRLHHAKELLGNHYKKTVAKTVDKNFEVKKFIQQITRKSLKAKWQTHSSQIASAILEESKKYEFDPVFLVAVIQTESSFSPTARGTSGEIGLMQLMPDTGKWVSDQFELPWHGQKTLLDPVANIRIGAAYLSLLREKFGSDGRLYIPAYNMGPRKLRMAIAQDVIPEIYAKKVMTKYLNFYAQIQESLERIPASDRSAVRKAKKSFIVADSNHSGSVSLAASR